MFGCTVVEMLSHKYTSGGMKRRRHKQCPLAVICQAIRNKWLHECSYRSIAQDWRGTHWKRCGNVSRIMSVSTQLQAEAATCNTNTQTDRRYWQSRICGSFIAHSRI